ncbi:SDR family NAD(P)-dependent oxidoreductase [Candidatus Litorirhabdus singularis]|nr:SDR family NAD(P)-dependent oxidoreductase [Candidatus Litorirhabdus singularis]
MATGKISALVTGASSGIGAEFCRQLAERCEVIIAVGRREVELQALAAELSAKVEVHCVIADLTTVEGQTRVIETLRQKGPVDYLVNNAGFSTLGAFSELDLAPQQAMVELHITAPMALCRAAIPFMRERGGGFIINVSSLVTFGAHPMVAVYGASKVFLNHFSEALQQELADTGIKVQSLCPGYTRSDFHGRDSMQGFDAAMVPESMWMEADEVVRISLAELAGDQVVVVTGAGNQSLASTGLEGQIKRLQG